jgi:hypothetical protein
MSAADLHWIPVEEELPPPYTTVAVCGPGLGLLTSRWNARHGWTIETPLRAADGRRIMIPPDAAEPVTHWHRLAPWSPPDS